CAILLCTRILSHPASAKTIVSMSSFDAESPHAANTIRNVAKMIAKYFFTFNCSSLILSCEFFTHFNRTEFAMIYQKPYNEIIAHIPSYYSFIRQFIALIYQMLVYAYVFI